MHIASNRTGRINNGFGCCFRGGYFVFGLGSVAHPGSGSGLCSRLCSGLCPRLCTGLCDRLGTRLCDRFRDRLRTGLGDRLHNPHGLGTRLRDRLTSRSAKTDSGSLRYGTHRSNRLRLRTRIKNRGRRLSRRLRPRIKNRSNRLRSRLSRRSRRLNRRSRRLRLRPRSHYLDLRPNKPP